MVSLIDEVRNHDLSYSIRDEDYYANDYPDEEDHVSDSDEEGELEEGKNTMVVYNTDAFLRPLILSRLEALAILECTV